MSLTELELLPLQDLIMGCHDKPLIAVVGGVGSGKTTLACRWMFNKIIIKKKGTFWFCSLQSSTLDVCFRMFLGMLEICNYKEGKQFTAKHSSGNQEITFKTGAVLKFKSAKAWQSWVSDSVDDAVADEPGDWEPEAHKWLGERMRGPKNKHGLIRQIFYSGVPQGQTTFMSMFSGAHMKSAGLRFDWGGYSVDLLHYGDDRLVLHYPTFFNNKIELEPYIKRLLDLYGSSQEFVKAHILGLFCPLFENLVYKFSSTANVKRFSIEDFGKIQQIGISFDFNVDRMAWTAYIPHGGKDYMVAEAKRGESNTDTACDDIIAKFPPKKFGEIEIVIDGDSNGHSRDTRSNSSDYDIILQRLSSVYENVWIRAPNTNGPQRASILAANRAMAPNKYLSTPRRLIVSEADCPNTIFALQNTVFEKNKIRKTGGEKDWFTDFSDTVRYRLAAQFPIEERYLGGALAG